MTSNRLILLALPLFAAAAPCQQAAPTPPAAPIVQPGAPGQPSKNLPPNTSAHLTIPSPADIDFMQGMIMHHSQAVEMTALIPTHTKNPAVRELGAKISLSQSEEIHFMEHWLEARNQPTSMAMPGMPDMDMHGNEIPLMPGMLSPAQMKALQAARGPQFDRLFLSGMIQHHTGALTMVDQLFKSAGAGQDADLFNFATDVDNTQRAEIRIMQSLLDREAQKSKEKP
jgi:uncharacterized protein (DUF305 family)